MKLHSFHIPVMGIGFTIDTPLKVSHLGIDSVISLVDDQLMEKLRKMYCETSGTTYKEIKEDAEDFRAKRITSYLNLIGRLAEKKFEEVKSMASGFSDELNEYLNMLPESSQIKAQFKRLITSNFNLKDLRDWVESNLSMGSIDVNIMTKVDKDNYIKDEKLPVEYNDAHAALRGYAHSNLSSSLILSAGMNPRLYSYMEQFEDFYPDANGFLKKKVILKVSDYRSALIQGKFLAKKGIWVSEYRIESGLNCGGHAFATDGYLLGPILAQFRDNKEELIQSVHNLLINALSDKNKFVPSSSLPVKITAQGGVGTAEEHQFLLDQYQIDSVGWGTPFLLVPEATTVDNDTLEKLVKAKEEDLYLSDISPLGVPFNNLRGNTKDEEKMKHINKGRPGSSCPKKYVALNTEFGAKALCVASRQYEDLKIKELQKEVLSPEIYQEKYEKIIEKSCVCVGLGTSALLKYNLSTKKEGEGVSICPGPNLAYFSKTMSLNEITGHIYGKKAGVERADRPHMFIKELELYIDFLKKKLEEVKRGVVDARQNKYLLTFNSNLQDGISYYQNIFSEVETAFQSTKYQILNQLRHFKNVLTEIECEIKAI